MTCTFLTYCTDCFHVRLIFAVRRGFCWPRSMEWSHYHTHTPDMQAQELGVGLRDLPPEVLHLILSFLREGILGLVVGARRPFGIPALHNIFEPMA